MSTYAPTAKTSDQATSTATHLSHSQRHRALNPVPAPASTLGPLQRLQQLANASPQVAQLQRLQALANSRFGPVAQLADGLEEDEPLQGKLATAQLAGGPEEEEPLQGKFPTAQLQPQPQQAPRTNNTGMPDQLKSGIESLSGLAMDHVKVHYNSAKPAQLNAHAYAQGSDIHMAPGQEQHLPHEAWHIVQQVQGRVQPTMQLNGGVPVNDDVSLEQEADVMGAQALAAAH
jgi:hypothetical protein